MKKRGQAALEYMVTYGWAFLAAIIAIGAMSYFGFINPSSLLPNRCSFGKQLECVDYEIYETGQVNLILRNNFGKDIRINKIEVVDGLPINGYYGTDIDAGTSTQVSFLLAEQNTRGVGDKQELNLIINFTRNDGIPSVHHYLSGSVFVTVK